jgi:D-psicose/D-tagatose/L-ribulose 3-epimerase
VRIQHLALALFLLTLLGAVSAQPKNGDVKIGFCSTLREIDAVRVAGFDFAELRTEEITSLTDTEYQELREKLKRTGLLVPVTYLFIPGAIKLTGTGIDKEAQMRYVRKAFDRVSGLGAEIVTFGSGEARRVPEGFPKKQAFEQLVEFCRRIGPEARARNLTVAIEPQRREECNIINTAAEALELIETVNDPNIQLMIDFYHLSAEKENAEIIVKARDHIKHLHIANPDGRGFPLKWEEYEYGPFFANLRRIGYDKRISIEVRASDLGRQAPPSIAFLRNVLKSKI